MTPSYLYSVRRSRGRAGKISQDSQTSLLWLWSRSNSLPFPEALSAMTQGFHYRHNQKASFHQPATQTSLCWKIGFVSVFLCRGYTHDLVWQRGLTQKAKKEKEKCKMMFGIMNMTTLNDVSTDLAWVNRDIKVLHLCKSVWGQRGMSLQSSQPDAHWDNSRPLKLRL